MHEKPKLPEISWRNAKCRIDCYKLHPLMLSPDGIQITRTRSSGRGMWNDTVDICFDKEYVIYRFHLLFRQLQFLSSNHAKEFIQELSDSWVDLPLLEEETNG